MPHKYTAETIFQYTCSQCTNCWTYKATENTTSPQALFCPRCGKEDKTESYYDPLPTAQPMVKLTQQRIACGD